MRLQPLYDLQQDVNRLFIAGSKLAKDDLKLQKHVHVFNKLGEKAPVFAKLAADIEELVNADPQQSAAKLTAISTLLYSILYTQGETFEEDKDISEQVPLMNINDVSTKYTYKQLHLLIEHLSLRRSDDRYSIIEDAKEAGLFNDLRTYWHVDYALNDEYGIGRDMEKEIPKIGKPMLPFLLRGFRYENKKMHASRLRLIDELGHPDVPMMINRVLSEPLPILKVVALKILSRDPSNEEVITKFIKDKDSKVCKAVYKALFSIGTKTAMERLRDALINLKNKYPKLKKGYWQLGDLVNVLASSKLPYLFEDFFAMVIEAYEDIFIEDKNGDKKAPELFCQMMHIFKGEDDSRIDDFYVRVLGDKKYFDFGFGISTIDSISGALSLRGAGRAVDFYERNIDNMEDNRFTESLWYSFIQSAEDAKWPKEKVYERFRKVFRSGHLSVNNLYNVFGEGSCCFKYDVCNEYDNVVHADRVDLRWLDELYKTFDTRRGWIGINNEAFILIDACETNVERFHNLMLSILKFVSDPRILIVICKYILKHDVPNKFEIVFSTIEKFRRTSNDEYMYKYFSNKGIWTKFPAEYEEKFRQLSEKKSESAFISIADEIAGKNKEN